MKRAGLFLICCCLAACAPSSGEFSPRLEKAEVKRVCDAVASWQMENFVEDWIHPLYWTYGTFYRGLYAWGADGGNESCLEFLNRIGDKYNWDMCYRTYHADDVCVGQTFIEMYRRYGEEKMIRPARERAFWVASHPSEAPLRIDDERGKKERWSWADALYMAPPVYAALYAETGEDIYLEFMDKEYHEAVDSLYDREENLFYRDCLRKDVREANGSKQFWARGNGWVLAGLAMVIDNIPADNSSRQYYIDLYQEMAARVVEVQDSTGSWHASLLDTDAYPQPESSSAGLFCYALAWGLNNGWLSGEEYEEAVRRGWASLVGCVRSDGLLGYVQPAGSAPAGGIGPETTYNFGVGAFLLAGSQVYQLSK